MKTRPSTPRRTLTALALLASSLTTGCERIERAKFERERDALLDAHRAELTAVQRRLDAAWQSALTLPPLTPLASPWELPPVMPSNDLFDTEAPRWNAVVVAQGRGACERSTAPGLDRAEPFRFAGASAICNNLDRLVRPPTPWAPRADILGNMRRSLSTVPRLRYAVYVRTTGFTPPRAIGTTGFTPGSYEGEARLYDLTNNAYLGGFVVTGATSARVRVEGAHIDQVDAQTAVERDFHTSLEGSLVGSLDALTDATLGASQFNVGYVFR